jgi:hypothetical protein
MAFTRDRVIYDVAIPLIGMDTTATIGITTLSSKTGNLVNFFIENNLMPVLDLSLVCNTCKRQKVTEQCRHKEYMRPWWQRTERIDYIQKLHKKGMEHVFARESQGFLLEEDNRCFSGDMIKEIFLKQRFRFKEGDAQRYLFLTIDPCGGAAVKTKKHKSEFAWVSHIEGGLKIIGLESLRTTGPKEWGPILIKHIQRCLQIPALVNARLIIFVESNMKGEAEWVREIVWKEFPRAIFPCLPEGEGEVGVRTTAGSKQEMQIYFGGLLNEPNGIQIYDDLITSNAKPAALLDQMKEQMLNFRYYEKEATGPFTHAITTYSGKGASGNELDDIMMALLIAVYCQKVFFKHNTPWSRWHRRLGDIA